MCRSFMCITNFFWFFFASPFKKLGPPFLLIACYSGLMVALPYVFGITFVLVARVGAANLLLPLNSQLLCWQWCFPFVSYYSGRLSNCAALVQWSTTQCQGILQFKGNNQFVPLLSRLFVLSYTGMMHLWPRRKVQTWICLGDTPHPRLSFKVTRLEKSSPQPSTGAKRKD